MLDFGFFELPEHYFPFTARWYRGNRLVQETTVVSDGTVVPPLNADSLVIEWADGSFTEVRRSGGARARRRRPPLRRRPKRH